jgi:hypothetical protein
MPYACIEDVASSWDQYRYFAEALAEPEPKGLILHLAGPTDEGFRIIDVWETEEAWQEFRASRLAPMIAALGGPSRPQRTLRELRVAHVVAGDPIRTTLLEQHEEVK